MSEKKKNILYLSLTGMSEPLGRSQVLEYIFKIVEIYDVDIISCEKPPVLRRQPDLRNEIMHHSVNWKYIPFSNRFGLFSAAFQLFRYAVLVFFHMVRRRPDIIHARSLIPAIVATVAKSIFGGSFVFDMRGFFVDEKVDSQRLVKDSLLYSILKKIERIIFRHSDHIISLTLRGKNILSREYKVASELITVIPTCVNTDLFKPIQVYEKAALRQSLGLPDKKILVHHGAVDGWYDFESEAALVHELYRRDKDIFFLILNTSQKAYIEKALEANNIAKAAYHLRSVDYTEIVHYLNASDLSLFFIKPSYSKQASHPTKFAENTACRLFSISNSGIGDMEYYTETYKTAFLIDLSILHSKIGEIAKQVLEYIDNLDRRAPFQAYERLVNECFSIDIAVERYMNVYKQVCGTT